MNKYLDIQTPDEYFQGKYIETSMGKDFAYVRETFYDFVKNMEVKYFIPIPWNLNKCFNGFRDFVDHASCILTADNKYYLILQPYIHVHPRLFYEKYYLKNQMAYYPHGFQNTNTYMIIFTKDFMEFMNDMYKEYKTTTDTEYLYHLHEYCENVLPDSVRNLAVEF